MAPRRFEVTDYSPVPIGLRAKSDYELSGKVIDLLDLLERETYPFFGTIWIPPHLVSDASNLHIVCQLIPALQRQVANTRAGSRASARMRG